MSNNYNPRHVPDQVTILNGQTTSNEINTRGASIVGIRTPAAFTGANISFLIGDKAGVFLPYFKTDGTLIQVIMGTDRHYGIFSVDFIPAQFVKIVSDATELGDRVFKLILTGV